MISGNFIIQHRKKAKKYGWIDEIEWVSELLDVALSQCRKIGELECTFQGRC